MTEIPSESGHFLWGSARELARAPHEFPAQLGLRHGGLASFRMLHRHIIAITDADLARQVLVTRHERYERSSQNRASGQSILGRGLVSTDGPFWLSHRRQMLPAFRRDRLTGLATITCDAIRHLLDQWETLRRDGSIVRLGSAMQELTISIMGRALLSAELGSGEAKRFGDAVRDSLTLLRARNTARLRLPLWIPSGANRRLMRTRDVLDRFVLRHIKSRKEAGGPGESDMLGALLASRDNETGAPFDTAALRDETKTLFVAGFETTATALTWTLYLLARHPEAAAVWHEEIDRVLNGSAPGWEDLDRLPATRAIIDEALRLYPPVYNLPRQCLAEDELAGYKIHPGRILLISIFGIHRSPRWWPQPERFMPERFAPGTAWTPHAFLPFGVGKHACIGADFAIAEILFVLALIGQRYRLELADPAPVDIAARITLVPAREITIRIAPRDGA